MEISADLQEVVAHERCVWDSWLHKSTSALLYVTFSSSALS